MKSHSLLLTLSFYIAQYTPQSTLVLQILRLRELIEDEFTTIHKQAERMTAKLAVIPEIPRTAMRKQYWIKYLLQNREEYYRGAITDRFVQEIKFIVNKFPA